MTVSESSIEEMRRNDLLRVFAERLEAVGGHVHWASTSELLAAVIADIADTVTEIWTSRDVMNAAPGLITAIRSAGLTVRTSDDPVAVRDQPLGLALGRAAIAETGSVILVEPDVSDRSVTLTTQTLITLCLVSTIVPSLDEAAGILRDISREGTSYATFITGPSRTADIERELTVGVQGPGVLHVLLAESVR